MRTLNPATTDGAEPLTSPSRTSVVWQILREVLLLGSMYVVEAANTFYAYVHFPLTALILIWLSVRRPAAYKGVRSTLMALTGLALIGHTLFPLAPPRMLPSLGWVDTGIRFGQSV